jgi:hypothetical protein
VPTPFEFAHLEAAWRSIAAAGPGTRAIREAGEERAKTIITAAYAPFRQPDGRYRFENAFRYVVARDCSTPSPPGGLGPASGDR